jgi:hypothetical protein
VPDSTRIKEYVVLIPRPVSRLFYLLAFGALPVVAQVPLSLMPEGAHGMSVTTVSDGVVEVASTGDDPFLYTSPLPEGADLATTPILSLEYFSLTGTGELQVFLSPPESEASSVKAPGLNRSEGWSSHRVDLTELIAKATEAPTRLRIDFGQKPGRTAQIRNIVLRPLNEQERTLAARQTEMKAREAVLDAAQRSYLEAEYPCGITKVQASAGTVTVQGMTAGQTGEHWLVELPVYADADAAPMPVSPIINLDSFQITVPRLADTHDRLFSRWAVALKDGEAFTLLSHGRYADEVEARPGLSEAKLRGRKGIGGFSPGRPVEDLEALGSSAVTINVMLEAYMRTEPGAGRTVYEHGGRTWYTDDAAVANLDNHMLSAAKYDQVVSAIILLGQAGDAPEGDFRRIVAHPDADPSGIFVMPNFTSAEGVAAYAAALNFLAERYSRPDGQFGRIHHWIMHNEVNSGWVWTNMGEKSALRYMDAYHKSMRMAHLIARQYDPFSRVYISLEHHWNSVYAEHCYKGKELMELLLEFSKAEGDFNWSIAHHPYPENLRDPRTWEDETAWFSFDTPRITFHNIEVLDAWVRRPEARYLGEHIRDLQFTEQGPNSPDYSEKSLTDQAASMAYLWKKLEALDTISMFHFHNWVDNRHEGGLRIGLRRFPDDEEDPHGKKPVWYAFQALDTPEQEKAIEFAKPVIGISDWSEVNYRGPIPEIAPTQP